MLTSITLLPELIDLHYQTKRPLMLVGPSGIGKTQGVRQYAKDKGLKLFEYHLASCEPGDIRGICVVDGDSMRFLRPEDFPKITDEGCIIFFDETNRATKNVINSIMQASDGSGRIANHLLPPGCLTIAAMKPDNLNYIVTSVDEATINRFTVIEFDYEQERLLDYGRRQGWHPTTLGFLSLEKNLFAHAKPFDGLHNRPSSRSMEALSEMEWLPKSREAHLACSVGRLGPELGMEYHAFAYGAHPVSASELLEGGEETMNRISDFVKQGRMDLIGATNNDLLSWLREGGVEAFYSGNARRTIVAYLMLIPKDIVSGFLTSLIQQNLAFKAVFDNEKALLGAMGEALQPNQKTGKEEN